MKTQLLVRGVLAALLVSAPLLAPAQSPHEPLTLNEQSPHEPLTLNETLGFPKILASALTQAPESVEKGVRQQQAQDLIVAGRSRIAGRPSLILSYYNDNPLDDRGQVEAEYGVQVPLWRPGERDASLTYGENYQKQVTLWQEALKLEIAGRVRAVLAAIHAAEKLLQLERETTATAEQVVRVTSTLFESGAVARLDVMQAEHLLLEQRRRELEAEAALVDAEINYAMVTGLEERPAAAHTEAQAVQGEITAEHPLLRYLQSDVAVADGAIRQSEIAAKGSPQLMLGSRRERGDRFEPYTDSINVSLTIPIGGKSFVSSRTSGAHREKVDAEVLYLNTQRSLVLALHDVEHELFAVRAALPLVEQQAALSAERRALAQTAFAEGEITLAQVLPAVQEARGAARERLLLQLRQQRLVTEFNQLIGVLP